jgi:hypothetical protein
MAIRIGVTLALLTLALAAPAGAAEPPAEPQPPLSFAPNSGQTDAHVRYMAQGAGYSLFFADDEVVLSLVPSTGAADKPSTGVALDLRFPGANPDARVEASHRAPGVVNQFTGPKSDWQPGISTYEELAYRELWPNIDLVFSGRGGELEYEVRLHPGADPADVRLAYAGAEGLSLRSDGGPVIHTPLGDLNGTPPAAGSRYTVQDGRYGVEIDSDDHSGGRVIHGGLDYSTFVGASANDSGRAVAVDDDGNAYVTGQTASANYPTTPGAYDVTYNNNVDAFVTKFDSSGSAVVYSTFLGGSAFDSGNGIAVDEDGSAYVAGFSGSTNYPTTPGAFDPSHNGGSDAFVTKLSPAGSALEYSSYLGAGGFSFEGANGIAVDGKGSAYVTGFAGSGGFPTTPGAYDTTHNGSNDVYVTKFDPSGSALVYSTFVGGSSLDTGNAIAVGGDGSAYVTGITRSAGFPTTPGAPDSSYNGGLNDAFAAKLDPSGAALVFSTFLGGAGNDSGAGIGVDDKGRVAWVAGSTDSSDYPTTRKAFDRSYNGGGDAFVARFDRDELEYSTFLGGTGSDAAPAIAVDRKGRLAYLTGSTASADYPATGRAFDRSHNGGVDAFVTQFDRDELDYSTFLGGTGSDAGLGIAVDDKGRLAYVTGSTDSADYPVTNPAFDRSYNGAGDGFLTSLATGRGGHAKR